MEESRKVSTVSRFQIDSVRFDDSGEHLLVAATNLSSGPVWNGEVRVLSIKKEEGKSLPSWPSTLPVICDHITTRRLELEVGIAAADWALDGSIFAAGDDGKLTMLPPGSQPNQKRKKKRDAVLTPHSRQSRGQSYRICGSSCTSHGGYRLLLRQIKRLLGGARRIS